MGLGTVKSLYRYPVKSMLGESLDAVHIGPGGIPGDRAWAVRDEDRGGIRGAKRFPDLMTFSARYDASPAATGSSPATITLPDGEHLGTGDGNVGERLSEALGSPVTLWPLMPADALDHYRRGAPMLDDMEAEFRRMFGREPDEPLPDLSVFPPELMEFESPLGTYFDAYPLLVMSQQSLDHMAAHHPESRYDVKRFRPNILLDCDGDGLLEFAWEGKTMNVGGATLALTIKCPRCVMTTQATADLPKDPKVMRALVKDAGGDLGIYASVATPGAVKIGDEVSLS